MTLIRQISIDFSQQWQMDILLIRWVISPLLVCFPYKKLGYESLAFTTELSKFVLCVERTLETYVTATRES